MFLANRQYWEEKDEDGSDLPGDRGDDYVDPDLEKDEEVVVDEDAEAAKQKKLDDEEAERNEFAKKHKMVPHAVMKEAVEKERKAREAATNRLAELEAAETARQKKGTDTGNLSGEIEELEELLDKAIADNDLVEKKRIRTEIRTKQGQLNASAVAEASARAQATAVEQVRYDALCDRLETEYPEINRNHDNFSQAFEESVMDEKDVQERAGKSSTEALKKAVSIVTNSPEWRDKLAEARKKPEDDKGDDEEAKAEAAKRKKEAVERGLAAKGKQPPNAAKGAGADSDKGGGSKAKNIDKMSEADFDKLSDEEKARMRGDTL